MWSHTTPSARRRILAPSLVGSKAAALLTALSRATDIYNGHFLAPTCSRMASPGPCVDGSVHESSGRPGRLLRMNQGRSGARSGSRKGTRGDSEGLWDWNLESDRIHFSPRWIALIGCEDHEVGSKPEDWFQRVHPDDSPQLLRQIEVARTGDSTSFDLSIPLAPQGRHVSVDVMPWCGRPG